MDIKKYINSAIESLKAKAVSASNTAKPRVLAPINRASEYISTASNSIKSSLSNKINEEKLQIQKALQQRQAEFAQAKINIENPIKQKLQQASNGIKGINYYLGFDDQPVLYRGNNPTLQYLDKKLQTPRATSRLLFDVPSYGIGGILKAFREQPQTQMGNVDLGTGSELNRKYGKIALDGMMRGVREKTPVFSELPRDFGMNPDSVPGMAVGLMGEIAIPGPGGEKKAGQKLLSKVDEAGSVEKFFQEFGKGKNAVKGLMNESPAQTAMRRKAGLAVEDVYKGLSPQTKFKLYQADSVRPTNLIPDVNKLTDISTLGKGGRDVYRNFEAVFKGNFTKIKSAVLDPFDASKGKFIASQKTWLNDLSKNVPFKKGSKESASIQLYGEGKISVDELVEQFGKKTASKIQEADKWFRGAYDQILDEVNAVRKQLYPKFPEMWIAKRPDYYRHFKELTGLDGLKNLFETPAGIDPSLVGISDFTTPRTKFLSFAQRRTAKDFGDVDAVGGFLDYLPKAEYAIHVDPHIQKFRGLQAEIVKKTGQKGAEEYSTMNNFIEFLEDYSNDLSGKTNPLDRGLQKYIPGGRKTFRVLDWMNKRVKANQILGNASSSVAQIFNVPQGIASAGEKNFVLGMFDAVTSPVVKTEMSNSAFLNERYFDGYDKFDTGILNDVKKFTVWFTGALDELGTKAIWSAQYKKAVTEGKVDPSKFADYVTRKLVGGRGVGEVPITQKSKVFQLVAPFTLEVGNMWWVMKDFVDHKAFGKLAKLLVYNYVFNSIAEPLVGRRITFDPINALAESIFSEEQPGIGKTAGRLSGEVLSNVPLGSTIAGMYPESGMSIAGAQTPTREKLFGDSDPTRYGGGLLVNKGLQDPVYKLLPPFGGAEAKKIVEGVKFNMEGGSYNQNGKLQYPSGDSLGNKAQSVIFGKGATKQARDYFETTNPLSEDQTKTYTSLISAGMSPKEAYSAMTQNRGISKKIDEAIAEKESFNLFGFIKGIKKETAQPTEKTGIFGYLQKESQQTEQTKILSEIFSKTSTPEQAQKAMDSMGLNITYQEAMIEMVKSLEIENGNRGNYLYEEMSKLSDEEFAKSLQAFVENKVITSSVVDSWENTGKISEAKADQLKNYIKMKTGKKFSAPKTKKFKINGSIKKTTTKLKLPKVNFKPLKKIATPKLSVINKK